MRNSMIYTLGLAFLLFLSACNGKVSQKQDVTKPNVIVIFADDLGYGDLSSYGATELSTPNIDKLVNGGVKFTNGYATSATCTPSRYALLTGEYPWRNEKARILPGSAPMLISSDQVTLPQMLKQAGYYTGIVGKWHLGLGLGDVNWNETIKPSPNDVGFDYSYIMAATQDRVPTVYIQDGNVVGLDKNDPIEVSYKQNFEGEPTGLDNPELVTMKWHHGHNNSIVNGIPRIGYMKGGAAAKWNDVDMADHFLAEAQQYVTKHKDHPFFLYYALQQPHVPRTPHPRFVGKSGMGPRGDVILEADFIVGELMKTLDEQGLLDNTIIIFSSDNGPVLNDGYYDEAVELIGKHKPAGALSGGKYSLLEAGTRVPFCVYWKGQIMPSVSPALISQVDLFNSLAAMVGSNIKAKDSEQLLDVLLGKSEKGREQLIIEANGRTALRQGDWILIPPYSGDSIYVDVNILTGISPDYQLYNLSVDLEQKNNLAKKEPAKVKEMMKLYSSIRGIEQSEIEDLKLE